MNYQEKGWSRARIWVHEKVYLPMKALRRKYLDLDPKRILPLVWLCGPYLDDKTQKPAAAIGFLWEGSDSLYRNGIIFIRVMLPFFISIQIRWAWSDPTKKEYFQMHVGWKINGEFAITCRVQSDVSAAQGTTGPNHGQARGLDEGTK